MSKETEYFFKNLSRAYDRLHEAANTANDQLQKDGTIQRFEFTFELTWKMLKRILEECGLELRTPREVLTEAFRIGLIEDDRMAMDMLIDRNSTSHVYDEKTADEIFCRIKDGYVREIGRIIGNMKRYL